MPDNLEKNAEKTIGKRMNFCYFYKDVLYGWNERNMSAFSTRELATAFWTGIILVAVGMAIVTNKKARKSFIEVLKCFFGRKIGCCGKYISCISG